MIYHGMADDNVLFTNSTALYKTLQDHGKVFEIMDYPGSKHSMCGEKVKIHLYKTLFSFRNMQFLQLFHEIRLIMKSLTKQHCG